MQADPSRHWQLPASTFGYHAVIDVAGYYTFEIGELNVAPDVRSMPIGDQPVEADTHAYIGWMASTTSARCWASLPWRRPLPPSGADVTSPD